MSSTSSSTRNTYRFRPRFTALAVGTMVLGLGLVAIGLVTGTGAGYLVGGGAVGLILGLLYLVSPAWRLEVEVTDEALAVRSSGALRFALPWTEVVMVWASPETQTCFVDGGRPERNLLVPGPGASAPYDIENKHELYAQICRRVPKERIREVGLLEEAMRERSADDSQGSSNSSSASDSSNASDHSASDSSSASNSSASDRSASPENRS